MKTSGSTSSQHLIYHNGKWLDFDDCDQSLIDQIIVHNGAIKIILGQFSESNRGIDTYRKVLGGLFSDNFKSYNKALLAYSREDGKELKRLAYVRHALPLDANSYPNGWFIKAPQAFCKNTSNHPAKVLVCFTGRSGMMDMSIPCFHSVAYDIFDTVVYIYRPRNNHYSSALDHLRIALGRLCMRLGTQDLYFTGVSAGGTAALWMHLHSVYSKGVMVTSPTLGSIPSLIELLANAGKEYWISARIFLATGNSLDLRSQQLLNSALDHNMLTDCIFNLNWASPSHGSMATLMSLGHLDKQLLWLRERVDGVSQSCLLYSTNMSKDIELMEQKTDEVLERICHRISQISRIDDSINLSSLSIDDTGIDSLELTEMILELEEHFSVIIDDSQLSGSTKISELAAQVAAQLY